MEDGSGNAKKGEVVGREMAHSSARSLTICNVAGVSFDNANANAEVESKGETGRRLCGPPLRGKPLPFGATTCEEGVNFAGARSLDRLERSCNGENYKNREGGRKPWHSINFVTAHGGFTLANLVSYNQKHNVANGEDNNDGENHNNSWNCGEEGEHSSSAVAATAASKPSWFHKYIFKMGMPMITMGDEYGHTKGGNNNTYCHDNFINYFRWDNQSANPHGFHRFASLMINFRRVTESLRLGDFPTGERLEWHGIFPSTPDWTESSKFVAFTLVDLQQRELYIAFNANHLPVMVTLPDRIGAKWYPLIDTSKPTPYDFLTDDVPNVEVGLDTNLELPE